jgi:LysM repeat protein
MGSRHCARAGFFVAGHPEGLIPGDPASRLRRLVSGTRRKPEGHQELLSALALVAILVQPGDTLSGIAAAHGATVSAVETANSQIHNFDLIFAGQTVKVPAHGSATHTSHVSSSTSSHSSPSSTGTLTSSTSTTTKTASTRSSSGYSSSSLSDIPGVPSSFAACVAYRESTNLQNPAANGNAYGIIPASGYNVYGTSIAHQKQVFAELYQQYGGSPWAADGCPGT